MAPPLKPLVAVRDLVTLGTADYFVSYSIAIGQLRMRVIHITGDPETIDGATWVQLMGVRLLPNGEDGPQVTIHARVAALRANPPERPNRGAP